MEQIDNLIKPQLVQTSSTESLTTTLPVSSQLSKRAELCLQRFGDSRAFFNRFSVANINRFVTQHKDRMFTGDAPSINVMRATYGDKDTDLWLSLHLSDIANFKGFGESVSVNEIKELKRNIVSNYGYLKATELMLFFHMFKASAFRDDRNNDMTKMYGHFNAEVIMDCLARFRKYRSDELDRIEKEEERERRAKEANREGTITYEEFIKLQQQKEQQK